MIVNGVFIDNLIAAKIPKWTAEVMKKDDDKTFLIDGREGTGKSAFGFQLAMALDKDFNLNKICFNSDQFIKTIKSPERKKGDCIVLDEAFSAASARASLSAVNKAMIAVATEMRQLNLYVIIILPTFFDLDRYFAIWRCDSLFHVYKDKAGNRGRYIIFPFHKKKQLYLKGKKGYYYGCVKSPYPACRFNKGYVVDELEYRKRKAEAFRERKMGVIETKWKDRTINAIINLSEKHAFADQEIAEVVDISVDNVRYIKTEYFKKNIKAIPKGGSVSDEENE